MVMLLRQSLISYYADCGYLHIYCSWETIPRMDVCCLHDYAFIDLAIRSCAGGNAEYAMDMHQKEQLHDNTVSMMQSQHFSVGSKLQILENSFCF